MEFKHHSLNNGWRLLSLAMPGKDVLRDMVFRGRRVLRSRIPIRPLSTTANTPKSQTSPIEIVTTPKMDTESTTTTGEKEKEKEGTGKDVEQAVDETEENEGVVADSMQLQMAFYAIPKELLMNNEGELLDSRETILWEGYLMRRVGRNGNMMMTTMIINDDDDQ